MRTYFFDINADFTCKNCGSFVTALNRVSGVVHRNHCPYCLHSTASGFIQAGRPFECLQRHHGAGGIDPEKKER